MACALHGKFLRKSLDIRGFLRVARVSSRAYIEEQKREAFPRYKVRVCGVLKSCSEPREGEYFRRYFSRIIVKMFIYTNVPKRRHSGEFSLSI